MQKHEPQCAGYQFAKKVDIAKLTGQFVDHLKTVTSEDIDEAVRRFDEKVKKEGGR